MSIRTFGMLALLFALPVLAQNKPPAAKTTTEAEKKIEALRSEIKTLSKAQRELDAKRSKEAKQLQDIDRKVASSSRALGEVESAVRVQTQKLSEMQSRQSVLESQLIGQKAELAVLLRSAYRLGENSELKHLLAQDKLAEASRWLVYHRYFERQRQAEIGRLAQQLQTLAALTSSIEQEKIRLAEQQDKQKQSVAELSRQRQQRKAVVSTLDAKYNNQQARIKALGKDEKALRGLLDKLRRAAQSSKAPVIVGRPSGKPAAPQSTPKNLTGWPLTGSLLAGYGNAMPDGRRSEGLLIAAAAGAPVYAVADGRVVYADWLKGYGMLLVIDHGRGYMSLYANNDALLKEVGDSVTPGERIATVGSSGAQNRAALYFEMRLNGQPQNPNSWLRP